MVELSESGGGTAGAAALLARAAEVDDAGGPERRHETVMERAERWGLDRAEAEAVYALAEQERVEPELALLLTVSRVGVQELESVDPDPEEPGSQQVPPDWVAGTDLAPEEAQRERRLRLSFRRLQSLRSESGSAVEAVQRFLAEPDVIEDAY